MFNRGTTLVPRISALFNPYNARYTGMIGPIQKLNSLDLD
jgi:hypothetical protein